MNCLRNRKNFFSLNGVNGHKPTTKEIGTGTWVENLYSVCGKTILLLIIKHFFPNAKDNRIFCQKIFPLADSLISTSIILWTKTIYVDKSAEVEDCVWSCIPPW